MRPDIKLGVAISLVVVLVAGGYYLYRDSRETPIAMADGSKAVSKPAGDMAPARSTQKKSGAPRQRPVAAKSDRSERSATAKSRDSRGPTGPDRHKTASRSAGPNAKTRTSRGQVANARPGPTGKPVGPGTDKSASSQPVAGGPRDRAKTGLPTRPPADGNSAARTDRAAGAASKVATAPEVGPQVAAGGPGASRQSTSSPASRQLASPTPSKAKSLSERQRRSPAAPTAIAVDTHRVQPGDTFSSLADAYYGSEKHARFLIDANPSIRDPNRLSVGTIIRIPSGPPVDQPAKAKLSADNAEPGRKTEDARRTHIVRPGDSFYTIARDKLGDAARWQELLDLNNALVKGDPRRLQVGQVVVLPDR